MKITTKTSAPPSEGAPRERRRGALVALALLCLLPTRVGRAHEPAEEMAEAATRLLATLTPEQRARASYAVKDEERFNWHFVPRARQGLAFKDLTPAQRPLATALLAGGLSHRGYLQAATIMSLEQVLLELEQGRGPTRDPELYFVTVFGAPGPTNTWGWRVEGHHLSVNVLLVDGHLAAGTPSFMGANPAEVRAGPRQGLRVLGRTEDLGRTLVKSLSPAQREAAVIAPQAPGDIVTGAQRKASPLVPSGLSARAMSETQRATLQVLIDEYLDRNRPELAGQARARIAQAGAEALHFAWAGGLEPGQPHYFRVQGPTFLLEYDNVQNGANHVHAVWREFANDFGEDLLRAHYDREHR